MTEAEPPSARGIGMVPFPVLYALPDDDGGAQPLLPEPRVSRRAGTDRPPCSARRADAAPGPLLDRKPSPSSQVASASCVAIGRAIVREGGGVPLRRAAPTSTPAARRAAPRLKLLHQRLSGTIMTLCHGQVEITLAREPHRGDEVRRDPAPARRPGSTRRPASLFVAKL